MNYSPLDDYDPQSPTYLGNIDENSDITDCPECDSNRTSYLYCVDGLEVIRCLDCDNMFEI